MNIAELLKQHAKKGDEFYTLLYGEVKLEEVKDGDYGCIVFSEKGCGEQNVLNFDGTWNSEGECVIFPSRDQRDWNLWAEEQWKKLQDSKKFKVGDYVTFENGWGRICNVDEDEEEVANVHVYGNKNNVMWFYTDSLTKLTYFNLELLKPFDKVLVRDDNNDADYGNWRIAFFDSINPNGGFYLQCGMKADLCIPYNTDTEKLHNTRNPEPEFYKVIR